MKKLNSDYLKSLVASIEDIADEFLDSNNIHTAIRLRRIASNVTDAFAKTDLLIDNLDLDDNTRGHVATVIKEAVAARKESKKLGTAKRKSKKES